MHSLIPITVISLEKIQCKPKKRVGKFSTKAMFPSLQDAFMCKSCTKHLVIKDASHIPVYTNRRYRNRRGQPPELHFLVSFTDGTAPSHYCCALHLNKDKSIAFSFHLQNSLEGGLEGVLTGVEAVRVLILRNTACLRCLRWARELAASGVFFQ